MHSSHIIIKMLLCIVLYRLAEEETAQFRALEVLMLDDNKLSSGVFSSLTNLKRSRCGLMFPTWFYVKKKSHNQIACHEEYN